MSKASEYAKMKPKELILGIGSLNCSVGTDGFLHLQYRDMSWVAIMQGDALKLRDYITEWFDEPKKDGINNCIFHCLLHDYTDEGTCRRCGYVCGGGKL